MNEEIVKEVQQTNIKGVRQAVASGLAVASGSKRAAPSGLNQKQKKALKVWGMEDVSDSDDSDSDEEGVEAGQQPSCPTASSPESGNSSGDAHTIPVNALTEKTGKEKPAAEQPSAVDETTAAGGEAKPTPGTVATDGKANDRLPLDLSTFASAEELQSIGLDMLKAELQRHGLKAGGTLEQRAGRLFLLRSTPLEKLDRSQFAKK